MARLRVAARWAEHDVRPRLSRRRSYAHPAAGRIDLELHLVRVHDPAELWQVVFAPAPETGTAERLRRFFEQGTARAIAVLCAASSAFIP